MKETPDLILEIFKMSRNNFYIKIKSKTSRMLGNNTLFEVICRYTKNGLDCLCNRGSPSINDACEAG